MQPSASNYYLSASSAWSLVEAAYREQEASGLINEAIIDALSEEAHLAFEDALPIVPRSLSELGSYLTMLDKRGIKESPEVIETALATIRHAVADLIADPSV